jgi:DNA-binding NarL/FixJ family response regulator
MVRIFHCDDSSAFRALIRAELEGDAEIEVIGDAADFSGALEGVSRSQPDVLLLDLLDVELDVVAEVAAVAPSTRVVVLSGYPREYGESLRANAAAYVEKDAPVAQLRETVLRVAGG